MQENELLVIYITYESEEQALSISKELLNKKIIACANVYPMKSLYTWKGEIVETTEYVSIVKSTSNCWEALQNLVTMKHSYDVPCIVKMTAEANPLYAQWVHGNTK